VDEEEQEGVPQKKAQKMINVAYGDLKSGKPAPEEAYSKTAPNREEGL